MLKSCLALDLQASLPECISKPSNLHYPAHALNMTMLCLQTMQKYLANVYRDPEQDKFRSIRLSNAAFQQRVASFNGSLEVLELCGFKVTACNAAFTFPAACLVFADMCIRIRGICEICHVLRSLLAESMWLYGQESFVLPCMGCSLQIRMCMHLMLVVGFLSVWHLHACMCLMV